MAPLDWLLIFCPYKFFDLVLGLSLLVFFVNTCCFPASHDNNRPIVFLATVYSELGRQRFAKLYNAASSGAPGPPADLRYLKQTMSVKPQHAELRGEVIGFLHQIYTSIAETLPDVRDGALEEEEVETGCSIQLIHADPYAAAVSDQKRQVLPEVDKTKDKKSAKGKAKASKNAALHSHPPRADSSSWPGGEVSPSRHNERILDSVHQAEQSTKASLVPNVLESS